ncbi:MAG TPA: hypothetical protein PLZ16_13985 [Gammaproteobacteria bacterium]|nr:hypothetical protein [Gammaproteobacteria bacterium]
MTRRATITDTAMRAKNHVITAEVPLATMFGYATQVRSLSQGRASYSMEPSRYDQISVITASLLSIISRNSAAAEPASNAADR